MNLKKLPIPLPLDFFSPGKGTSSLPSGAVAHADGVDQESVRTPSEYDSKVGLSSLDSDEQMRFNFNRCRVLFEDMIHGQVDL